MDIQPTVFTGFTSKQQNKICEGVVRIHDAYADSDRPSSTRTGIFGLVDVKGHTKRYFHEPCHGSSRHVMDAITATIYTPVRFQGVFEEEDYRRWLQYIMYESVWKDTFFDTGVDWAMQYGILTRCDVPSNLMIGGIMGVRSCWEEYNRNKLAFWNDFVKAGMHPDVAFALAHFGSPVDFRKNPREDTYNVFGLNHDQEACSFRVASKSYVANFLFRQPCTLHKSFKEQHGEGASFCSWKPVQGMWGPCLHQGESGWAKRSWYYYVLNKAKLPYKESKSFSGVSTVDGGRMEYQEMVDAIVKAFVDFKPKDCVEWIDV